MAGSLKVVVSVALLALGCGSNPTSNGRGGSITLTQQSDASGFNYVINAFWGNYTACTTVTLGQCSSAVCDLSSAGNATTQGFDAGPLLVTGSNGSTASLSFDPTGPNSADGYQLAVGSTQFFAAGDTVTVSGAGGADLPAFSSEAVVAPSDVLVSAPSCVAGACPSLDSSQDVSVVWSGSSGGALSFSLFNDMNGPLESVACSFDLSSGAGTVPHELLAAFPLGSNVVETAATFSSLSFTVGGLPTAFDVVATQATGTATVAN
ncbi:MAG TPA: hypothetical protein VK745_28825 [Polyangiaceae bacterium]|nr:hypothetical protein [Polyangiaceae bacterium]